MRILLEQHRFSGSRRHHCCIQTFPLVELGYVRKTYVIAYFDINIASEIMWVVVRRMLHVRDGTSPIMSKRPSSLPFCWVVGDGLRARWAVLTFLSFCISRDVVDPIPLYTDFIQVFFSLYFPFGLRDGIAGQSWDRLCSFLITLGASFPAIATRS